MPGSVSFLNFANSKGVTIYYISGRTTSQLSATINNLERIKAPQVSPSHILLQTPTEKDKYSRFDEVAKSHDILLYFGDNLSDFPGFHGKTLAHRDAAAVADSAQFGSKYIIFPNPMYGDWEGAMYDFNYDQSNDQLTQLREEQLKYFNP